MYQHKLEKDIRCPLEYGLGMFCGKWKSRVICILAFKQVLCFSEIRREMVNITDGALSTTLKELIADDIVVRKTYDGAASRVEYSLTDKGLTILPIFQEICHWAGAYYIDDPERRMMQCRKCNYRKDYNVSRAPSAISKNPASHTEGHP